MSKKAKQQKAPASGASTKTLPQKADFDHRHGIECGWYRTADVLELLSRVAELEKRLEER